MYFFGVSRHQLEVQWNTRDLKGNLHAENSDSLDLILYHCQHESVTAGWLHMNSLKPQFSFFLSTLENTSHISS